MRSRLNFLAAAALLLLAALAACRGDDGRTVEAAAPAPAETDPWALPPDSLYGATAIENLRVVPAELEIRGLPRGWDGMRVAVLSDFLLGLWPDNEAVAEAAVRRAVDENPDLVVLLGDFVAAAGGVSGVERALAPLQGRGALAVLGERDLSSDTLANAVAATLRGRGVTVLRNTVAAFARGSDTAYIAGVEPGFFARPAPEQAELFAAVPEGGATPILLVHTPEMLPQLPEGRFPVVFAGHAFCGEADVPGSPRLATLAEQALAEFRVARTDRLFRGRGSTMLVTCGVGYGFVPARVGAPPEIVLVTLRRIPDPRPVAPVPDTIIADTPSSGP